MNEKGYDSIAEAARSLFREGTEEPAYISIQKERMASKVNQTPEEKIKSQVEKETLRLELKEKAKTDKHKYFCSLLDGKCTDDGYCEYPQFVEEMHEKIAIYPQRDPLEYIGEKTWEAQFVSPFSDDRTPAGKRARIHQIAKNPKNADIKLPDLNN